MTSSYSVQPNEDSLPPLALSLPTVAGGELSMSTMSMAMPPSATELHTPSSPPAATNLMNSVDQTPRSPPIVLEDSSVADVSALFDESSQHAKSSAAAFSTTATGTVTKESAT